MDYQWIEGGTVTSPRGFLAGACYVGVKSHNQDKPDVAMLYSEYPTACAALFTTNRFCAAPILLGREVLKKRKARAAVINSGNANAATGEQGLAHAKLIQREAARLLSLEEDEVFVCSTGVIGQFLPVEKILKGMEEIAPNLDQTHGSQAAWAIMTTDLVRKECAMTIQLSQGQVRLGAMCKGSGMIHPNMATMLAYLTTDLQLGWEEAQTMLEHSVDESFHMLSVDGDTSTNDSVFLFANGASGVQLATEEDRIHFGQALDALCIELARRIAADGEGATHLLVVDVLGMESRQGARQVARSIVSSSLLKAALFGRDANWGRIMAAAGYSGADVDPTRADCILKSARGEVMVMQAGLGTDFDEEEATGVLSEDEVNIIVDFHSGPHRATAFGCDLTYEYVRINGDYRS